MCFDWSFGGEEELVVTGFGGRFSGGRGYFWLICSWRFKYYSQCSLAIWGYYGLVQVIGIWGRVYGAIKATRG